LIASLGLVNGNLAVGTGFGVVFEKGNRSDGVRIADMVGIIATGLEFPAIVAGVFVTDAALPGGRDEAVAVGISAAMDELIGVIGINRRRIMTLQLTFCLYEIVFALVECFDLFIDIPDLSVNVLDELFMNDGGLCGRKHGLFLGEENVLLMLCELASEEGLSKTEVLKLRMGELSAAEEALGNRDIIATEEGLVAGATGGLGTGVQRATNGFAVGGIE
jgi:hypothetical protein